MNNFPNGFRPLESVIRVTANDINSRDISPLVTKSGITEIAQKKLKNIKDTPGLHVDFADRTAIFNLADVRKAAFLSTFEKDENGVYALRPKNPVIAEKMRFFTEMLRKFIVNDLLLANVLESEDLLPITTPQDIDDEIKKHGGTLFDYLLYLQENPLFTALINNTIAGVMGKFETLDLTQNDLRILGEFLQTPKGEEMFRAIQQKTTPEMINSFFRKHILEPAREQKKQPVDRTKVWEIDTKYKLTEEYKAAQERKEVAKQEMEVKKKELRLKNRVDALTHALNKFQEGAAKNEESEKEHMAHLYDAVDIYMRLASEGRQDIGHFLYRGGISEDVVRQFYSRLSRPEEYYRELNLARPNKTEEFWRELQTDSETLLRNYKYESMHRPMAGAVKATNYRVTGIAAFKIWIVGIIRSISEAYERTKARIFGTAPSVIAKTYDPNIPNLYIEHKGKRLEFQSKDVGEAVFKHYFAKTPLLRHTDGTIKVERDGGFIANKEDRSAASQLIIERKKDALQHMLHNYVQAKTAVEMTIDKASRAIAEWQFKKHPVHPVTKEPLSIAMLQALARREVEGILPNMSEVEERLLSGMSPWIVKGIIISDIKAKIGQSFRIPFARISPDPDKQKMFAEVDLVGSLNTFWDIGDKLKNFDGRFGKGDLGEGAKNFNAKFKEILIRELERYDDLVPGSKEYAAFVKFITDHPQYMEFEKTGIHKVEGSGERKKRGEGVQELIAKRISGYAAGTIKMQLPTESEEAARTGFFTIMAGEGGLDRDLEDKWPGTKGFETIKNRDAKADKIRAQARETQKQRQKESENLKQLVQALTIKGEAIHVRSGIEMRLMGPQQVVVTKIAGQEFRDLTYAEFQNRFMGPRGEFRKRFQNFIERGIDVDRSTPELVAELQKEAQFLYKYADDAIDFLQKQIVKASPEDLPVIEKQIAMLRDQSMILKETDGKWKMSMNQLHKQYSDKTFAGTYMARSGIDEFFDVYDDVYAEALGRRPQMSESKARMERIIASHCRSGFYDLVFTKELEKYITKEIEDIDPRIQPARAAQLIQDRENLRTAIEDREFAQAFVASMKDARTLEGGIPIWGKRVDDHWTYQCSAKVPQDKGWEELSVTRKIESAHLLFEEYLTKERMDVHDPATEDVRKMIPVMPKIIVDDVTKELRIVTTDDYAQEAEIPLSMIDIPGANLNKIEEAIRRLEDPRINLRTPQAINTLIEEALSFIALVKKGVGIPSVDQDEIQNFDARLRYIINSKVALAKAKAPEFALEKRQADEARAFAVLFSKAFTDGLPIWKQAVGDTWRYQAAKGAPEGGKWEQMETVEAMSHLSKLAKDFVTPEKIAEGDAVAEAITEAAATVSKAMRFQDGEFGISDTEAFKTLPTKQQAARNDSILPHEVMDELEELANSLEKFNVQTMEDATKVLKVALACNLFLKKPDEDVDNTDLERLADRFEVIMNAISAKLPFLKSRESQFNSELQSLMRSSDSPQILFDRTNNRLVSSTQRRAKERQLVDVGEEARQTIQRVVVLNKQVQGARAIEQEKVEKEVRNTAKQFLAAIKQDLPIWRQYKDGNWIYQASRAAPKGVGWYRMSYVEIFSTLAELSKKYVTTEKLVAGDPTAKSIQEATTAAAYVVKTKDASVNVKPFTKEEFAALPASERTEYDKNVKPSELFFTTSVRVYDLENSPLTTLKEAEFIITQALGYYGFLKTPDEGLRGETRAALLMRLERILENVSHVLPVLTAQENKAVARKAVLAEREKTLTAEFKEFEQSVDTPRFYFDRDKNRLILTSQREGKAKQLVEAGDELRNQIHEAQLISTGLVQAYFKETIDERKEKLHQFKELILSAINAPVGDKNEERYAQYRLTADLLDMTKALEDARLQTPKESSNDQAYLRSLMEELKENMRTINEAYEVRTQELADQIKNNFQGNIKEILKRFIALPQKNRIALGDLLVKNKTSKDVLQAFNEAIINSRKDNPTLLTSVLRGNEEASEREIKLKQLYIEIDSARALIATTVAAEDARKKRAVDSAQANMEQLRGKIAEVNERIDRAATLAQLREVINTFPGVTQIEQLDAVRSEIAELEEEATSIKEINEEFKKLHPAIKLSHPGEAKQIFQANENLKTQIAEISSAMDNAIVELKQVMKTEISKSILRTNEQMREVARQGLAQEIVFKEIANAARVPVDALAANMQIRSRVMAGDADEDTKKLFLDTVQVWFKEHNINPTLIDGKFFELMNNPQKMDQHPEFLRRLDKEVGEVSEEVPAAYMDARQRHDLAEQRSKVRRNDPVLINREILKNIIDSWKGDPEALALRHIPRTDEIAPVGKEQAGPARTLPINLDQYRRFISQKDFTIYSPKYKAMKKSGKDESQFAVTQACYAFVKSELAKPQSDENIKFLRSEEMQLGKALLTASPTVVSRMRPIDIRQEITGAATVVPHRTPEQEVESTNQKLQNIKTMMFHALYDPVSDTREGLYAQYRLGTELLGIIENLEKEGLQLPSQTVNDRRSLQARMSELKACIFNSMNDAESVAEDIVRSLRDYPNTNMDSIAQAFVELPKETKESLSRMMVQNYVSAAAIKELAHVVKSIKRNDPIITSSGRITGSAEEQEIQVNTLMAELQFTGTALAQLAAEMEQQQAQVSDTIDNISRRIDQAPESTLVREAVKQFPEVIKLIDSQAFAVETEIRQLQNEYNTLTEMHEDLKKLYYEIAKTNPTEAAQIEKENNLLKMQMKEIASHIDNVSVELKEKIKEEVRRSVMRRREDLRKEIRQAVAKEIVLTTITTASGVDLQRLIDNLEIHRNVRSGKASVETARQYAVEIEKWFKDNKIDPDNVDRMITGLMNNPIKIDQHPIFLRRLEEAVSTAVERHGRGATVAVINPEQRSKLAAVREQARFEQLQALLHAKIDKICADIDQAKIPPDITQAVQEVPFALYTIDVQRPFFNKEVQQLDLEGEMLEKTLQTLGKEYVEIKESNPKRAAQIEAETNNIKQKIIPTEIVKDIDNAILDLKSKVKDAVRHDVMGKRVDNRITPPDRYVDGEARGIRAEAREKVRMENPIFFHQYKLNKLLNQWEKDPTSLRLRLDNNEACFVGGDETFRLSNSSPITLEKFRKYRDNNSDAMVYSSKYKFSREQGKDFTQIGIDLASYGYVRSELAKPQSEANRKWLKAQEEILANAVLNPVIGKGKPPEVAVPKPAKAPKARVAPPPSPKVTRVTVATSAKIEPKGLKQTLETLSFGDKLSKVNSLLEELLSMDVQIPQESELKKEVETKIETTVTPVTVQQIDTKAKSVIVNEGASKHTETVSTIKAPPKAALATVQVTPIIDEVGALFDEKLKQANFISSTILSATKLSPNQIDQFLDMIRNFGNLPVTDRPYLQKMRVEIDSLLEKAIEHMDQVTIETFSEKSVGDLLNDITDRSKIGYDPNKSLPDFMLNYGVMKLVVNEITRRRKSTSDDIKRLNEVLAAVEEQRYALESIIPMNQAAEIDQEKARKLLLEVEFAINRALKANAS